MSELVTQNKGILAQCSNDELDILRNKICPKAPDLEIVAFIQRCKAIGLDPFSGQIFMVSRWDKKNNKNVFSYQTGIDGYRSIAAKSNALAGIDEPIYDDEFANRPKIAKATVHRMVNGNRVPFTGVARWSEFFPGDAMGFMWKSKPFLMLGKCAEAQALRKAFPVELGQIYTTDETQMDDVVIASQVVDQTKTALEASLEIHDVDEGNNQWRDQIANMFEAFSKLTPSIPSEMVLDFINKKTVADIDESDLEILRKAYEDSAK